MCCEQKGEVAGKRDATEGGCHKKDVLKDLK